MKFSVVTTYGQRHWHLYAEKCIQSFMSNWHTDINLIIFDDDDLERKCDWLPAFKARNGHRPTGNYRYDAVRFSHKVAALDVAFSIVQTDVLIWMDADCFTHAHVDAAWLSSLMNGADFAYLRRTNKYPECGFMMLNAKSASVKMFMNTLTSMYRTDALFKLREWHDSFVIDYCRERSSMRCQSLSGNAESTGHPLVNGPLGARLDHLKGKRKQEGRSRRADLKVNRTEAYWQQ